MSTLSLRLPNSLHARLRELAKRDEISINQLVTLAAAEKVATLLALDYLEERAGAADLRAFDRVLARVPPSPPLPGDELEAAGSSAGSRRASPVEVRETSGRYRSSKRRATKKR